MKTVYTITINAESFKMYSLRKTIYFHYKLKKCMRRLRMEHNCNPNTGHFEKKKYICNERNYIIDMITSIHIEE